MQARDSASGAFEHETAGYDELVAIPVSPYLIVLACGAIVVGLGALVRGFGGYRTSARISDTSGSRISSIAVGEVRLSGVVEAAEVALVSPLQSARCVYYRASIEQRDERSRREAFSEERSVGFRIRDETGSIRVFPRDARWDVPVRLDASTGVFGDEPAGLQFRLGPAVAPGPLEREAQVAALLTVHEPSTLDGLGVEGYGLSLGASTAHCRYIEARIEPGDVITVIGRVLPFDQLEDPAYASVGGSSLDPVAIDDPEVALDLAEARAAGLAVDPATAWGNAAIPGFGIGRPTVAPALDPAADRPALAPATEAARSRAIFEIDADELVLASAPDAPLLIATGTPGQAAERQFGLFLLGLLGAVVAIVGALALALLIGNSTQIIGL